MNAVIDMFDLLGSALSTSATIVLASATLLVSVPAPMADWLHTSPAEAGLAADIAEQIDRDHAAGKLPGLHAVVVARHGKLVVERYYSGEDQRWGDPLGHVEFDPETLHDIRSISKSVVSLLYGIALEDGIVPALNESLVSQFPDYPDLMEDPIRRDISIRHALTMTMGTEWDETIPYSDPRNSEIAMERSDDRYRFVLDRPIVTEPGSRWVYNGGTTAVLAGLIARRSGQNLFDYAREHLFDPLGIEKVEWVSGFDGDPAAASGLRMRPRDLAKIGQLVLQNGTWEGDQVVPEKWVKASSNDWVYAASGVRYGYQWWLGTHRDNGHDWMAGFGNGGQRVIILPALDMVIVITAGRYNDFSSWQLLQHLQNTLIIPAVQDR